MSEEQTNDVSRLLKTGFLKAALLLIFCFVAHWLAAQESILASYERNFIRASITAKTGILLDAATDERAGEFIGDLYELALQFAVTNGEFLRDDPDMITLLAVATRGAGMNGNKKSITSLWKLFAVFTDSHSQVEILGALGMLGKDDPETLGNLNQFLDVRNKFFRAGIPQDYSVIRACIAALGMIGDDSSFSFLFAAMTAGYPQVITQEALWSLESIQNNYKDHLVQVIRYNPFSEKAAAFRLGVNNDKLRPEEKAEIAHLVLEIALAEAAAASETLDVYASLRYDAVTVLTRLRWTPSFNLAIRNFYRVQIDYTNGVVPRERFLEAIAFLGAMENAASAQSLALQLGYFNSLTERTGDYDEAVILALVAVLGELGDKAAFDNLLYISYLNYPDRIQAAAREALNQLRW